MINPFEQIEQRFDKLEQLLQQHVALHQFRDFVKAQDLGLIDLAVEVTHLKKPTIYRLVNTKGIPFHKRGGRLYFSRQELIEWLKSKT
jgi:excisionase family DNA binding protein